MNVSDYTFLINKPTFIQEKHTVALKEIVDEYPFFQSAQALRLKGLYQQNSFEYNKALKTTAAYTTDRSVLFDFITSNTFTAIHKGLYEKKLQELLNITVVDSIEITSDSESSEETKDYIVADTPEIEHSTKTTLSPEEKLSIGKPLEFSENEQHSFQEWLQLSRLQPIKRTENKTENTTNLDIEDSKKKKLELIDKFIENNPKIPPIKQGSQNIPNIDINLSDTTSLMTETLARVYLEQKKYQRAIQAYEILILKYPEKSSFFADRISDIKILQQNNK